MYIHESIDLSIHMISHTIPTTTRVNVVNVVILVCSLKIDHHNAEGGQFRNTD